jgi:SAM-dependent methyltransferase
LAKYGAECVLLDISNEALKVARSVLVSAGLVEPFCYNEDALNNSVPSDAFDVAWNGGVIEHFDDTGKVMLIKEMLRQTRPGGKVIVLVPNAWYWQFQLIQAWQKWRGTWAYGFEDDMSPRRLEKMCEHIGLANIMTYAFNPILGWRWVPIIRRI